MGTTDTPSYPAAGIAMMLRELPSQFSVLIKGPTGVGKSSIVRDAAAALNLPVMDIRLALRTEGDMLGLPDPEASAQRGVTVFSPPAWLKAVCEKPYVLFFDEFNRAERGVRNAALQIVLDRCLGENENGQPYYLHPDTRIVAAINEGADYIDVEDLDPALVRRFLVVSLEPSEDEWTKWALSKDDKGVSRVDPALVQFLRENPSQWNADLSKVQPGSVFPTPASWVRVSDILRHIDMAPSSLLGQNLPTLAFMTVSASVGTTAAASLRDFLSRAASAVTGKELYTSLNSAERAAALTLLANGGVEAQTTLVDQISSEQHGLVSWLRNGLVSITDALQITDEIGGMLSGEYRVRLAGVPLRAISLTRRELNLSEEEVRTCLEQACSLLSRMQVEAREGVR